MPKHGINCPCRGCYTKFVEGKGMTWDDGKRRYVKPKSSTSFSRKLSDGTTIFGDKSLEGRTGYKHGHKGSDFHRTPHSTIGSAAIGKPHTEDGHKTRRW